MLCKRWSTQDDATTGWPSLGWTITKPGSWKVSWKDLPEPRPMREPILKVLLICGCRFADQQIAACGSTKVGCCELSRRAGSVIGARYRLVLRWRLGGARRDWVGFKSFLVHVVSDLRSVLWNRGAFPAYGIDGFRKLFVRN